MNELLIETSRLIISPVLASDYESITNLYSELEADIGAAGVFGNINAHEVEKALIFGSETEIGFNLAAKSKDKNAFIGYIKCGLPKKGGFWIYTFAIVSSMRRKGYGRELADAVIEYMRASRRINSIYLSVVDSNKNAKIFWKSLGFRIDKTLIKSGLEQDKLSKINIFVKLF